MTYSAELYQQKKEVFKAASKRYYDKNREKILQSRSYMINSIESKSRRDTTNKKYHNKNKIQLGTE